MRHLQKYKLFENNDINKYYTPLYMMFIKEHIIYIVKDNNRNKYYSTENLSTNTFSHGTYPWFDIIKEIYIKGIKKTLDLIF